MYYATTFDSPLSPPAVAERLRAMLAPKRSLWDNTLAAAQHERWRYVGQVDTDTFDISPVRKRRSVSPLIHGKYAMNATGGTMIRLRITPRLWDVLFLIAWFAFMIRF